MRGIPKIMVANSIHGSLIDQLPSLRGRLDENKPLGRFTWFKVGGPADILFRPADLDDLIEFLAACPKSVPVIVMGNASNIIVRDGGIRGVVIRLGAEFQKIHVEGNYICAGAAAADLSIARTARDLGLGGLEFLSGIPGAIGGAVVMNAGAYGREIKDVLISCSVVDRNGVTRKVPSSEIEFGYRKTSLLEDWIVTSVQLRAAPSAVETIRKRMMDIQNARLFSQPIRELTGGSTFKNPPGFAAWKLIDSAGCRGLQLGGAIVSEQHCNFLVNGNDATATDLEMLGEEVRLRVMDHVGVNLEWEIRRVGQWRTDNLGMEK